MNEPNNTTHFGFREVGEADKARLVGEVFSSVARNYDVMNDLMSFGVHRLWKRHFVATSGVRPGDVVLDLAGGTGDIAALLLPRVGTQGQIVVGDINGDMLRVGRDRLTDRGLLRGLDYACMDAEALPFPDGSFDCVTMAFGLRNVTARSAPWPRCIACSRSAAAPWSWSSPACVRPCSSRFTISIPSPCCRVWAD